MKLRKKTQTGCGCGVRPRFFHHIAGPLRVCSVLLGSRANCVLWVLWCGNWYYIYRFVTEPSSVREYANFLAQSNRPP